MKWMVAVVVSLTLSACATPITQNELTTADYGSPVTQEQAQEAAQTWLSTNLKDPASARETWQQAEKGIISLPLAEGGGHLAGYLLNATVNAKNSYGGYTGAQDYQFLIRDGKVVHAASRDPETGAMVGI